MSRAPHQKESDAPGYTETARIDIAPQNPPLQADVPLRVTRLRGHSLRRTIIQFSPSDDIGLLPLRSNGSWFTSQDAVAELERRVKHCLVSYDRLLFEDARYRFVVWEHGVLGLAMRPDAIPGDR